MKDGSGPDYAFNIVFKSFPVPGQVGGGTTPAGIHYYESLKDAKRDLPFELAPTMVTFTDPQAPTSVKLVYESNLGKDFRTRSVTADSFESAFGVGVKLKRITIEMTDEPVTTGIENIMPRFGKGSGFSEWQKTLPYGHSLRFDRSVLMKK